MKQYHQPGDTEFYSLLAEAAERQYDRTYAEQYRLRDEEGINNKMHVTYCELLAAVSDTFGHAISVLDLGCGTGRYFHCLKNVDSVVGVDMSFDMLKEALRPVNKSKLLGAMHLVRANMFDVAFRSRSFDLAYCIGVIGDWCPLDLFLLDNVYRMLEGKGKFVFTVIDKRSPAVSSWKRMAATAIRPLLPSPYRRNINARLRSFRMTETDLRELLNRSAFSQYEISRRYSPTGRTDLVCVATS